MRTLIVAMVIGGLPLGAYAHQTLSTRSYIPSTQISAPIDRATYDGGIWITYEGQPMLVALGTPMHIKSRGLPLSALADGKQVTVDVLNEPVDARGRHQARRIQIDGKDIRLL